jgi:hypothetical protein
MYPLTSGILAANISGDAYGNPRYCYLFLSLTLNCLLHFFIS